MKAPFCSETRDAFAAFSCRGCKSAPGPYGNRHDKADQRHSGPGFRGRTISTAAAEPRLRAADNDASLQWRRRRPVLHRRRGGCSARENIVFGALSDARRSVSAASFWPGGQVPAGPTLQASEKYRVANRESAQYGDGWTIKSGRWTIRSWPESAYTGRGWTINSGGWTIKLGGWTFNFWC